MLGLKALIQECRGHRVVMGVVAEHRATKDSKELVVDHRALKVMMAVMDLAGQVEHRATKDSKELVVDHRAHKVMMD